MDFSWNEKISFIYIYFFRNNLLSFKLIYLLLCKRFWGTRHKALASWFYHAWNVFVDSRYAWTVFVVSRYAWTVFVYSSYAWNVFVVSSYAWTVFVVLSYAWLVFVTSSYACFRDFVSRLFRGFTTPVFVTSCHAWLFTLVDCVSTPVFVTSCHAWWFTLVDCVSTPVISLVSVPL